MTEVRAEARRLWRLAVPVVLTQIASMMLGVVDTIMVGRVGVDTLAAASLGHLWTFGTLIFAMGAVIGMDPLITQAAGARDRRMLGLTLQRGIVVSVLVTVPITALWMLTAPALRLLGQEPRLATMAAEYVWVQLPTVVFFLIYTAQRQWLSGRGIVTPALWVALMANVLNALFNWTLIFGNLGFPALELKGAGIATGLTRALMCVLLLGVIRYRRLHRAAWVPWTRDALKWSGIRQLLQLGTPVGVQFSLEVWAFQICTLLAGRLGEVALAAHTIVLNIASLTFMVPLGISIAAVTRVGTRIGQRNFKGAQESAWLAMGMGAGVMCLSAVTIILTRHLLPRIYTDDAAVIAAAATILPIAAAFQLFDGIQVTGGGVLRGMGSTVPAAVTNLVGYYGIALPLAWYLGLRAGWGLPGIWWGTALGLFLVAITLIAWISRWGPARAKPVV